MNYKTKNDLPHISKNFLHDILKARGIEDPEDYISLESDKKYETDWTCLSQVDEAIPVFQDAISGKYSVGLIADCDVDGYCSAAMTYLYMKDHNKDLEIKVFTHTGKAHGIDDIIMNSLTQSPVDILIIPDASSSELEAHEKLANAGTRILVLDHHLSDVKEDNYAIRVNNQLSGDNVNKTLCGAGVVFFFITGYDQFAGTDFASKYIDLCAVALVADMMDLRNIETHFLVQMGLHSIHNAGLRHMVISNAFSLGNRTELTPIDVAFYIAPLMNAVIRVGTMEQKECLFNALIDGDAIVPSTKRGAKTGDIEIAGEQAARVAKNCKALQTRLVDRAMEILEAKIFKNDLLENKILLVPVSESDDIPSTITGLVAMKLTAKYHHPTMVLRECDDGVLKGSIRAEADTAMGGFKEYLDSTGLTEFAEGHSNAAGSGIKEIKVHDFLEQTNRELHNVDFNEKFLSVDYIFTKEEDISTFIFSIEEGREFWGQNVEEPTFVVENIPMSKANIQLMKNNCLKFTYNDVTYVIFKNEQAVEDFTQYDKMDITIYGKGSVNEWLGRRNAQVIINQYDIKNAKYVF